MSGRTTRTAHTAISMSKPYSPPDGAHGDVYDRIIVRLLEVGQSIDIIRQCLDTLPAGEILVGAKDGQTPFPL